MEWRLSARLIHHSGHLKSGYINETGGGKRCVYEHKGQWYAAFAKDFFVQRHPIDAMNHEEAMAVADTLVRMI